MTELDFSFRRFVSEERFAIKRRSVFDAAQIKQCGEDIEQIGEFFADGAGCKFLGVADDHRNPAATIKRERFLVEAFILQHFTVVGGVDDDSVVEDSVAFERGEHFAEGFVNHGDGFKIGFADFAFFFRRIKVAVEVAVFGRIGKMARFFDGLGQIRIGVYAFFGFGNIPRRVRFNPTEGQQEGFVAVFIEPVGRAVGKPVGSQVFFGNERVLHFVIRKRAHSVNVL